MPDLLIWAAIGGALGACLAYGLATFRRDLELSPPDLALSAAVIALSASVFARGWEALIFIAALSVLALTDLKRRLLPNELTYGLIVAGAAFAVIGPRDPVMAVSGAAVAAAALGAVRAAWLWARGQEALGLGDVKMLAGVGAFVGPFALPEVVFWAAIAGLAIALAMTLMGRRDPEIPFGAAMALSAWLYLACGPILFAV